MNIKKGFTWKVTTGASLILLWAGTEMNNALAGPRLDAPRQQIVTAKDLELSRPEGIDTLYQRIWAAAVFVCKPYNADISGSKVAWDSCRDATIAYTVARFDLPALRAKANRHKTKPVELARK